MENTNLFLYAEYFNSIKDFEVKAANGRLSPWRATNVVYLAVCHRHRCSTPHIEDGWKAPPFIGINVKLLKFWDLKFNLESRDLISVASKTWNLKKKA